jgi:hypothetical protein
VSLLGRALGALDRATGFHGLRWGLRRKLDGFLRGKGAGRVLKLSVDPRAGSLEVEALLKGEREPISVRLEYGIRYEGDRGFVSVRSLRCSREWIDLLAREYLPKGEIPLPDRLVPLARDLLG